MWFGNFFYRTLWLSLSVALRWLPVVALAVYGVYLVFLQLADEPIALGMLFVILVQPLAMLLAISAIRGGMMALRVTKGADLNKLFSMAFKATRFNLPLMWVITLLFGLGTTITGLRQLGNDFIPNLGAAWSAYGWSGLPQILEVAGEFPAFLLLGWRFGGCIAFATMGVALAGVGAMAAVRPPNHHQIWGIGAQFFNLFLLSITVTLLPAAVAIYVAGGIEAKVSDLLVGDQYFIYGTAAYIAWSLCALSAGAALSYSVATRKEEEGRAAGLDAMSGPTYQTTDLRALRQGRTPNHSGRNPRQ